MVAIVPVYGLDESRPDLASFFFLGLLPLALILTVAQPVWLYVLAGSAISMGRTKTIESEHPYKANGKVFQSFNIAGASALLVAFDENTSIKESDTITFYKDDKHKEFWGEHKYNGKGGSFGFPGLGGRPPLRIPADNFVFHFESDSNSQDWGYKLSIAAKGIIELDNGAFMTMLSELVAPFESRYWWFKSWLLVEQVGVFAVMCVMMCVVSSLSHHRHVPPCALFKAVFVAMITLWRSGDSQRHSAKMQLIASLAWCCVTLVYAGWSRAYKENIEDASDIFARCCTVATLIVGIMLYYEALGQIAADWILAGTNLCTAAWFLYVLNPIRIIRAARRAIRDKIVERKAGQWNQTYLHDLSSSGVFSLSTVELRALSDVQRTWLSEQSPKHRSPQRDGRETTDVASCAVVCDAMHFGWIHRRRRARLSRV